MEMFLRRGVAMVAVVAVVVVVAVVAMVAAVVAPVAITNTIRVIVFSNLVQVGQHQPPSVYIRMLCIC